ncbi:GlsB/YeaQ/YmgE family stress response membrane protein [bacterium]|nr:GlsB/YeaQ/YmgE family stress response membrane protein [bacterium]
MIWTILVGFAAGALAKYIMPGEEGGGFILTTLLGIAGAVIGSFLIGLLGIYTDSIIGDLVSAVIGALVLLWAWNKFKK